MPDWDWVAIATFALALATVWLGFQAKWARDAAAAADTARQREAHILSVRPLLVADPGVRSGTNGVLYAKIRAMTGDAPVLNLNVTIRGEVQSGEGVSASTDRGSLPPDTEDTATVELSQMLDLSGKRTWGPALEVVITYHGLLGQWVVEHYEWRFNERAPHTKTWRLYRLEIEPRGVTGAPSIDQTFGAPPLYV